MGHNVSKDPEVNGPFAPVRHAESCYLRQMVEKRDFLLFVSELKVTIRERESIGFAAPYMLDGKTAEELCASLEHDVLAYRVDEPPTPRHYVFLRCYCKGRYIGMDINKLDSRGQCALHVAVRKRDQEMVRLLLNLGANPMKFHKFGLSPMHIACETGDHASLEILLKAGGDPNIRENQKLSMFHDQSRTCLIIAATHGYVQCISVLLDNGADVNQTDSSGNTALHKGCVYGNSARNTACVKMLLDGGADTDIQNELGATPLQLALMQQHTDVVRQLMSRNCDVTKCSRELPSPLTVSAMMGEKEVLDECLKHHDNFDDTDSTDRTPLYYTFTGDIQRLKDYYPAIQLQGITFDFHYSKLPRRKETFATMVKIGANVEKVLRDAIFANTLTVKHFTLPQNVELFKLCICACGFSAIADEETESLFWKLVSRNGTILVKIIVAALPRLDHLIQRKLLGVVDWTGEHTEDAVQRHLENAGADYPTAAWIHNRMKECRLLQDWSREAIRKQISTNVIHRAKQLPLPRRLINYVMLADEVQLFLSANSY